jgi:hypothetical protein
MNDTRLEAAIFFDSFLPEALRLALDHAGDDGFVASLPQLLQHHMEHLVQRTYRGKRHHHPDG